MAVMAGARVLGIPELLEIILRHYAASETTTLEDIESSRPVTALFVWQRVSWTFKNVIASSRALRQAMFLEHADESGDDCLALESVTEDTAPIEWLLSTCKSLRKQYCRLTVELLDMDYGDLVSVAQTRPWDSKMKYATASWRKMKQTRYPGQKDLRYVLRFVDVSRSRKGYNPEFYYVEAVINRRGTLGEMYSLLSASHEHSFLEHRLLAYYKRHKLRSECGGKQSNGGYTIAQERAVLKYFEDIQKHVGGSKKGDQASDSAGKKKKKKKKKGKKTTKKRE